MKTAKVTGITWPNNTYQAHINLSMPHGTSVIRSMVQSSVTDMKISHLSKDQFSTTPVPQRADPVA